MDAKFLEFYNQELTFIRESAAEFAQEYPKIAGRLGLDGFDCADPYVERLLEGFAFLSARIHNKLDASFPEFTQHLLELLFPTFLQPVPSMLVAQFQPDYDEGSLLDGVSIAKQTSLFSLLGKDEQTACEYRTSREMTLWPLTLIHAEYINAQELLSYGADDRALSDALQGAKSAIKLTLETPPNIKVSDLSLDSLHLHLRGTESFPFYLLEALFSGYTGMMFKSGDSVWRYEQAPTRILSHEFNPDAALLPFCQRQFDGFRLLRELFAFPQRFLFATLDNLQASIRRCEHQTVTLMLLLNHHDRRLENRVSASNFSLHAVPAINLFPKRAERINLSGTEHEFQVIPDRLRPLDYEVCAIENVTGYGSAIDQAKPMAPLYAPATSSVNRQQAYFTQTRRTRAMSVNQRKFGHRSSYIGSEVFLTIVDPKAAPYAEDLRQLAVETLCCNRDLPLMMPLGKASTDFNIDTGAPCTAVRCLGEPTSPTPPLNRGNISWDLINLLSLNFLGFDGDESAALNGLKRLLSLMLNKHNHSHIKQVDGLIGFTTKTVSARLPFAGPICFGRGVEITLTVDESAFAGSSAFLLGMVLERFFAQYVSTNSFSKFVLRSSERGEIYQWPIRIGSRSTI